MLLPALNHTISIDFICSQNYAVTVSSRDILSLLRGICLYSSV